MVEGDELDGGGQRRASSTPGVNRSGPSGGEAEPHTAAPLLVGLKVGEDDRGAGQAPQGGTVMDVWTLSHILSPFTGTDNVRFETFPVFSDSGGCAPAREPV